MSPIAVADVVVHDHVVNEIIDRQQRLHGSPMIGLGEILISQAHQGEVGLVGTLNDGGSAMFDNIVFFIFAP